MIDMPFKICAAATSISLNVSDDEPEGVIEFNAIFAENKISRVRIKCARVVGAKISPFGGDPGSFERIGILHKSPWLHEIATLKEKHSPGSSAALTGLSHYYFRGEDATAEVICEKISWEKI